MDTSDPVFLKALGDACRAGIERERETCKALIYDRIEYAMKINSNKLIVDGLRLALSVLEEVNV